MNIIIKININGNNNNNKQQQQQGLMPHSATPYNENHQSPITYDVTKIFQAEEQQGTSLGWTRWYSISTTNNR